MGFAKESVCHFWPIFLLLRSSKQRMLIMKLHQLIRASLGTLFVSVWHSAYAPRIWLT